MPPEPLIHQESTGHTPESLVALLDAEPGVVLLRSAADGEGQGRYSLVTARPLLTLRSFGQRCEVVTAGRTDSICDNPWIVIDRLLSRFALPATPEFPLPMGGCFGFWGYGMKHFVEPTLPRHSRPALALPDCQVGFYDSVVVFDHQLQTCQVVSTGFDSEGTRSLSRAATRLADWCSLLNTSPSANPRAVRPQPLPAAVHSNLSRREFIARVKRALSLIHAGDIYQVNLSHQLAAEWRGSAWDLFLHLGKVSPAPFSAYLDDGEFQIVSSSPEQFLRLEDRKVQTRPIKGTRPRGEDAKRDEALARQLLNSPKERAELLMITDLLRNDLGRVCEYGSVMVPELAKLERYAQVQHLVSTVTGRLRPEVTHCAALAACFPGGSITGAPKFRAMEIIDELETVDRGPYTGALGYLGFNRSSQVSVIIRTAVCVGGAAYFHVGAGIVADSNPAAEYEETIAKAGGFLQAIGSDHAWHGERPERQAAARPFSL